MRVMMLLKSDANAEAGQVPDEKLMTDMGNYNQAMVDAGVLMGAEGLRPTSDGARVRIVKGKTTVVDGPFAEAKEVIAGYFMLKTKTLEEAIEWAKKLPGGDNPNGEGEVELRPLFETDDFPVDPAEQPGGWREKEIEARETVTDGGPSKGDRYVGFLKADKNTESGTMMPSEKLLQEMGALMQEMVEKGVLIAGDGLKPSKDSVRVRLGRGKTTVIDGPFSESKELVGGFTLFRAKTKAEACEWGRRCLQIHVEGTGVDEGEIEVRRVYETEDIPVTEQEKAGGGWREQEKKMREKLGN
jgi:hypothetical protein